MALHAAFEVVLRQPCQFHLLGGHGFIACALEFAPRSQPNPVDQRRLGRPKISAVIDATYAVLASIAAFGLNSGVYLTRSANQSILPIVRSSQLHCQLRL